MKNKTVAILEARASEQMADLVRKYGGTPFSAPALSEVPDVDLKQLAASLDAWEKRPPDIFIFQTGVGTRALFASTDALGATNRLLGLLDAAKVVVRGPKPTAALRAHVVRIDLSAKEPYTTAEVLNELGGMTLQGKHIVVQRYGETNWDLLKVLENKGAHVSEIATYRWGLPEDTAPLIELIGALESNKIDLVAFTSASQVQNLFAVAQQAGRKEALQDGIDRTLVASIGPVCTAALKKFSVRVDVEARPPKLGPFVTAINERLSQS